MPWLVRSSGGICCVVDSSMAPNGEPAGMLEVTRLLIVPSTGRVDAFRARLEVPLLHTVQPAPSVAEMSRGPGSVAPLPTLQPTMVGLPAFTDRKSTRL